ncbi:peptidyl-prolyl cis-trans isomerase cpr6 [Saitoella coloradoensis]
MPLPRVFLDVRIGTTGGDRIIIQLFTDRVPKTCENFRSLCTSENPSQLTYRNSIFHRVIETFMVQGGDITKGDGTGGASIYNDAGVFEDEDLGWREIDEEGLVCMANRGKDTNNSQFFITLGPAGHLNGKHVVFGKVVKGMEVVREMEEVEVDEDDRPIEEVKIIHCGELEFKGGNIKKVEEPTRARHHAHAHVIGHTGVAVTPALAHDTDTVPTIVLRVTVPPPAPAIIIDDAPHHAPAPDAKEQAQRK